PGVSSQPVRNTPSQIAIPRADDRPARGGGEAGRPHDGTSRRLARAPSATSTHPHVVYTTPLLLYTAMSSRCLYVDSDLPGPPSSPHTAHGSPRISGPAPPLTPQRRRCPGGPHDLGPPDPGPPA